MLDLKFIIENKELIKNNCRLRKVKLDFEELERLAQQRKTSLQETEELHSKINKLAEIAKASAAKKEVVSQDIINEGKRLKEKLAVAEGRFSETEGKLEAKLIDIPNLTHPDSPTGESDADNKEIRTWGNIMRFEFQPRDHVVLGKNLDIIDFDSGTKTTGNKFYFLKNDGVLLEFALVQYAFEILQKEGFVLHTTPDLARLDIIEGVGFIPRGPEAQIYRIENENLGLIATAEITLGGMYRDEVLAGNELPVKLAGVSHCFRTEAGAYGRASKGLYRVHQFTKVEMFVFSAPESSDKMLDHIVQTEEKIFQGLGIPYHVVDCCTADLGGPAYRKFDLEAWLPADSRWGEVTSASNCTDYQSRSLNIKYKNSSDHKSKLAHTLNGTAIAVSRAIIAIMENYQQEDGSIKIPEPLQRWMGKEFIKPR
ncbi:MAG: serine--tRNA ligase [Patescibacteria group bacterium]